METGFEPVYAALQAAASPLGHSTVKAVYLRADDEARTRDLNLGKVALYQLSYVRRTRNSTRPRRGGKSGRPLLRSHLVDDRSDSCNDVHCSIDIEYPIDHR